MSLGRKFKQLVNRQLHARNYALLRYQDGQRPHVVELSRRIAAEVDFLLDISECCQIANAVEQTNKLGGAVAEVGVYQGGSARLIAEFNQNRPLHLFDTFAGLPAPQHGDAARFEDGMFAADLSSVQRYLSKYDHVFFHPGHFPQTAGPVRDLMFSFVHLDVDLYQGTLECLEFFYPRMCPGAVLISHDYSNAEGVGRAFTEFFAARKEPVLEVALSQALIVKI